MLPLLPLLLLLQTPPAPPPAIPGAPPERLAPATIIAEPLALVIAAADADGDARTSRAELAAALARSFAAVAKGGRDIGYIAFADWARRELGNPGALPSPFEVDRDGDNRITQAELQARFEVIFARLDADKDGLLTRAELLTIRASGSGGFGGPEGGPDGRRRGRDRPPGQR